MLTLILRPLVALNKADRATSRPAQVESDLFNLFVTLGATDEQADYPLLYASPKQSWGQDTPPPSPSTNDHPVSNDHNKTMTPLSELILKHVPSPSHLDRTAPFSMLTVQIESDPYVGILLLGRVHSGILRLDDCLGSGR
jgi:GTP-binding protein